MKTTFILAAALVFATPAIAAGDPPASSIAAARAALEAPLSPKAQARVTCGDQWQAAKQQLGTLPRGYATQVRTAFMRDCTKTAAQQ